MSDLLSTMLRDAKSGADSSMARFAQTSVIKTVCFPSQWTTELLDYRSWRKSMPLRVIRIEDAPPFGLIRFTPV